MSEEAHPPYERPELSKKIVTGEGNLDDITILDPARAESLGIRLRTGCAVRSIDRLARIVRTDEGDFAYDWLVLATGGRARLIEQASVTGLPTFVIRTADDARRLHQHIRPGGHVAVIGGGWLGLELAASCRSAGMQVNVLEASARLCSRVAPEVLSRALLTLHQKNGVNVRCRQAIAFRSGALLLEDETEIRPDFLVIAIGMDANDSLAAEAGLATQRGILVDAAFQTEDPHILAIGDCAAQRMPNGHAARVESWQNANHSALVAACGIVGVTPPSAEPLWFWSDQFGSRLQMAGDLSTANEIVERMTGPNDRMAFHLHNGRFIGVWALNAIRDFATARRWLNQDVLLSPALLADADQPLKNALVP
jgi:3-phenylpropionate/trans-cinnamate dioxygenase ferredoxin reductase component